MPADTKLAELLLSRSTITIEDREIALLCLAGDGKMMQPRVLDLFALMDFVSEGP